jgi:nucleoid-associated protein YgaU
METSYPIEGESTMPDEMKDQTSDSAAWDATQWHEVAKGDTLSKIAQKYYGDASLFMQIFEANKDTLSDPNLIRVGQKLRIP